MKKRYLLPLLAILTPVMAVAQEPPVRWLPHFTREESDFEIQVQLANTDFEQALAVEIVPYDANGLVLDQLLKRVDLAPGHVSIISRSGLGWGGAPVSHAAVLAPEAVRISASYMHESQDAMPALVRARSEGSFSASWVPFRGGPWFEGIVVMNPTADPVEVIASTHDAMGNTLRTTSFVVPALGKWAQVAADLFEGSIDPEGLVALHSETPLLFMTLRGSLAGVTPPVLTEIPLDPFSGVPAPLTYTNQISRIVERKCSFCHRVGGVAPFPLTGFEAVFEKKDRIDEVVSAGIMPPTEGDYGFELDPSYALDPAERDLLLAWIRAGAPEGEPGRAPNPPQELTGDWQLGDPDLVLGYPEPFAYEPGPDAYRCFPLPVNNAEPLNLRTFEILTSHPELIHHTVLFLQEEGSGTDLDDADAFPGYACFDGPGIEGRVLKPASGIGGEGEGDPGPATVLPAQATLILLVHYRNEEIGGMDRTLVGLYLSQ